LETRLALNPQFMSQYREGRFHDLRRVGPR
jgi:hypothetical protein